MKGEEVAKAERQAEVVWEGDLARGSGRIVSETSGVLGELPVSWASRTETPGGKTSPEELIAAAHAACFSMAFSNSLAQAGTPPERLAVTATSSFDQVDGGWKITAMDLQVRGRVPGMDEAAFRESAEQAEQRCPVSNALRGNVEIRVQAELESA
jgi:osmotically inducible protein OsmC